MAKKLSLLLLMSAFLLLAGCGENNESVNVRLVYKPGEIRKFRMEAISGGTPMKSNTVTELQVRADSVKGNTYVLETRILRARMDLDMFGKKESYDSAEDPALMTETEKELHEAMKESLENPYALTIDTKGKVITPFHMKGSDKAGDSPFDVSALIIPFPDHAIKVGSQWQDTRHNALLRIDTKTTYKVKSIDSDEIVIDLLMEIGAVTGLLKENKATGYCTVDRETGQLTKAVYSMTMQGSTGGTITCRINTDK